MSEGRATRAASTEAMPPRARPKRGPACWEIHPTKPDRELKKKVLQFVEDYESQDTLMIVYYAGRAWPNVMPGESPDWLS